MSVFAQTASPAIQWRNVPVLPSRSVILASGVKQVVSRVFWNLYGTRALDPNRNKRLSLNDLGRLRRVFNNTIAVALSELEGTNQNEFREALE
jgi:hypothetical protein